ncbi:carboxypeptidase-like regulatory domain-containing protein [Bacteroidota bacterium]
MKFRLLYIIFLCLPAMVYSQDKAHVYGRINGTDGNPVFLANIAIHGTPLGTVTDEKGYYELEVPAGEDLTLVISYLGHRPEEVSLKLNPGERFELNRVLEETAQDLDEVTILEQYDRNTTITRIDIKTLDMLPNVSGNVESILSTLPGVSARNELSSQYSVRGGNFDENLVYVNDVEIHRPFLIRSSQQEGMSFINPDMVSSLKFSAGGFEASYGDKMSSVLDIAYRRPYEFAGSANISLLGGSVHLEGISRDKRFTHISGFRYRTTQYLLSSLETKGEYNPNFLDFQTLLTYHLTPKWEISFLGNIANNRFHFIPETRRTDFGTYRNPLNLVIYYEGQERDRFDTYTGAMTLKFNPNNEVSLKLIGSAFSSIEQENYDIFGEYLINELDNRINSDSYGDSILNIGIGAMHDHARNELNAFVYSLSHLGTHTRGRNTLKWGFKWQQERIHDQISEWEMMDSVGYSLPYTGTDVLLFDVIRSKNRLFSNRLNSYLQNTYVFERDSIRYFLNAGLRGSYWDMNGEFLLSPRLTFSVRPYWELDMVFRLAAGYYFQPPFYKEMRYPDGQLNKSVQAQKSIHFVLGGDYVFTLWNRPFKFTTEFYYKHLDNLIPYKLDNVRIQYAAENLARGYAVGMDMKIHGEFVPGAASWASLSFMKTEEDIIGDFYYDENGVRIEPGYYARPTDQRVMVGVYFRDYFPNNPDYKVHLNLVYGSGLPFSPPDIERYDLIFRMPSYKRVDIGFSKVLKKEESILKEGNPFRHFSSIWISAEIFNLLGVKNTASYLWVKTVASQVDAPGAFAVPNYLTGRRFNLKLTARF